MAGGSPVEAEGRGGSGGQQLVTVRYEATVFGIEFHADGRRFVTASDDRTAGSGMPPLDADSSRFSTRQRFPVSRTAPSYGGGWRPPAMTTQPRSGTPTPASDFSLSTTMRLCSESPSIPTGID